MSAATKTYGDVTHKDGRWRIRCDPHVLIRLKRLFKGSAKAGQDYISIPDTPEACVDIEWVLDRYPMTVAAPERLTTRAQEHRERVSAVDAMLSRRVPPPPFELALPPREYQRIAAAVALETRGLILGDDLGLGKTLVAIAMMTDPRTLPALVVTMTHLPPQWLREIGRFAPKLKVHVLTKATPYDLTAGRARRNQLGLPDRFPDVIISNYHKLAGWVDALAPSDREPLIRSIVFDEGQELRNDGTQRYDAAERLAAACQFRLALTATPVINYGVDFYNLANIVRPGVLGTKGEFTTEWCVTQGNVVKLREPKAFGTYVRESGLMLRRTRADVGRELPAVTRVPMEVEADESALKRIEGAAAELACVILQQHETKRGQKLLASGELDSIVRQATGLAKAPYVADFVRMLVESGKKVVLYGWHHAVYAIWKERLADLKPVMFTGAESAAQKEAAKQAFVNGDSQVLIMSLRAGAGLDGLQAACSTVVFGELDWSHGVHEQAIGRVDRDGQTEPVMAFYLVSTVGADPIMIDVLGVKKGQADGVRDPSAELVDAHVADPDHVKRLAERFLREADARWKGTVAPTEPAAAPSSESVTAA